MKVIDDTVPPIACVNAALPADVRQVAEAPASIPADRQPSAAATASAATASAATASAAVGDFTGREISIDRGGSHPTLIRKIC